MEVTRLLTTPAEPAFQGLSSALIVDGVLWLGSYNTDRIAYTPLPH